MATVTNRFVAALGPVKMEVVYLTSLTDQDTFSTTIQRPIFALTSEFGTDANSTAQSAISGKTVTVHNPTTGGGSGSVVVAVFGF